MPRGLTLGDTIRKLRLKTGIALREMARRVGVSASHQSDIEHGRRMPSDELLQKIAAQLAAVGGTYESLRLLKPQLEDDLDAWVTADKHVRQLLREAKDEGLSGRKLLDAYRSTREGG